MNPRDNPFTLDEINGYIEVIETLHPPREARSIAAAWSEDKRLDKAAFDRMAEYLRGEEE